MLYAKYGKSYIYNIWLSFNTNYNYYYSYLTFFLILIEVQLFFSSIFDIGGIISIFLTILLSILMI